MTGAAVGMLIRHVGAAVAVALAVLAASNCGGEAAPSPAVQVRGTFSGTVSIVAADGSAFCIRPDAGSRPPVLHLQLDGQACSVPVTAQGSPRLTVGQHVSVAVEQIPVSRDLTAEVFLVYAPAYRGGSARR